jgi:hypothetical protein
MIINPRSWPHPVLSPLSDDILSAHFDFKLTISVDYDRWRLAVSADMEDETILNLIQTGEAIYLLHIECRRTFYREAFVSKVPQWETLIDGPQLFGSVEASMMVIASADVDAYSHPNQHSDYQKASFSVAIGEPVAVAETQVFDAFNEPDVLRNLNSIITIRKGKEELQVMEVICEEERIVAVLPPVEYVRYCGLRDGKTMAGVLANSVVLPTLQHGLHYLLALDELTLSEFKANHRWARLVLLRLEGLRINIFEDGGDGAGCLRGAQELLRAPLRRSLEDLYNLLEEPDQ